MIGVIVNTAAVILGGLIGFLLKKGIPKRVTDAVMAGLGGCTLYIGIDGSLKGNNVLIAVASIVLGAIIGTLIDLDRHINRLGSYFERKMKGKSGGGIAQGFVTGSLMFCVGSMAVVGSLNAGISGDNQMLFAKSLLDFISAAMLCASLGFGVILAAGSVFVIQGAIVLLAQYLAPVLTQAAIAELTCVGSIIIILMGFNMMGIGKFKVANYLPALLLAPLICWGVDLVCSLGWF